MKLFNPSRRKILLFNKFLTKLAYKKKTIYKVGPWNIPWDPINTKQLISDFEK